MRHRVGLMISALVGASTLGLAPVSAQTFNSGSTGADGAFSPTTNTTLALPASGVFNFTTINVPSGVTLRFTRNTSNTPVTLLASGDVTIAGTIDVGGARGGDGAFATILASNAGPGGPGAFDGGAGANGIVSSIGGAGLGPGGGIPGQRSGGGGGFAAPGGNGSDSTGGPAYGTPTLLPLIGGSGGAGGGFGFGTTAAGGGGGGGAVLIASSGTLTFTGTILARGGDGGCGFQNAGGGGSGGAVRLAATTVTGSGGTINVTGGGGCTPTGASGGNGSVGRIRIEAFTPSAAINFSQVTPSIAQPTSVALASEPTLRITSVAGVATPAAPSGSFSSPDVTLPASTVNPVAVAINAANIPAGTAVTVRVRGQTGTGSSASATLAGTQTASTATASATIPTDQPSVITAEASFTLTASSGGGPVYAGGEEVERVRVTASYGGASQVTYITKSGREIVVASGR